MGDLELGAPEIADRGLARLNATRVALLGTVRFVFSLHIEQAVTGT
jgi:hypothetical protein